MTAGVISTAVVLMLLGLVARNFIRNVKDPPPGGEWRLIRTHLDAYLLSLLGSEILQGIGAIMNAKWVLEGALYCSDYCSVQGALKTIGEAGVGMNTIVSDRDRDPIVLYPFIVRATLTLALLGNQHTHLYCRLLLVDTRPTISLDLSHRHYPDLELPCTLCHHCLPYPSP